MTSKEYSLINLLDEKKHVSALYGITFHPIKFLIDKEGKIIATARGFREWDADEMKELVRRLSEEK